MSSKKLPVTRWKSFAVALVALSSTVIACSNSAPTTTVEREAVRSASSALVGNGKIEAGEQCDDGNTVSGDGCSAAGLIEAGYLCLVPGRACSLASLCGNNVIDSGEACDDGNTTAGSNGCAANCNLSLCGNGVVNNRQWPNFDQEVCDDGNVVEGDGCSRLCEVEPGFVCSGSPSRCVRAGVALFNTGVDANNRRLESGADPHWFYVGTTTGAATGGRNADDWPQELQTARFMAAPLGAPVCIYQDFVIPSTLNVTKFRVRIATFNDNAFDSAQINGTPFTPVTVSEPPGQPWQKNSVREFGSNAPWRSGLNRITLCNENEDGVPNAFRYLFVDAYDDRCGDGVLSPREECDDGNTVSSDGCSASCGIEAGYSCQGTPSVCAVTCGNGALNGGEECDDGNKNNGDGCNASCRVEAGYACPLPGAACSTTCGNGVVNAGEQCDDGNATGGDGCSASCRTERGYECNGSPSSCALTCGNGRLDAGELCDDGNSKFGDGCSSGCTIELGYACPTAGQACVKTCGNGTVNTGEQCDDGNLVSGDGCNIECRSEVGYACSRPASGPSVCVPTCGNGALDANETCDDGNTSIGDGCSQGCQVEVGFSCSGVPSVCATICGDGIRSGNEQCDDGNTAVGDGCNAACGVEAGWRCPPPGNVCFPSCGNGSVESGESCDDGNTKNGDGCDGTCRVEGGFVCSGKPSSCIARCADGIRTAVESCDDGNVIGGDGCDATCKTESGYTCSGSPSICGALCGDGIQMAAEACDDGNVAAGDGCDVTCHVEAGFGCKGNPGAKTICQRIPVLTNPPPPARLTSGLVGGTATAGATVRVYLDGAGAASCTATADNNGQWSCTLVGASAGAHSTVVTSTVSTATETAPAVTINIDPTAPAAPVILVPASNAHLATSPAAISGTAEPDSRVTVREAATEICSADADAAGLWSCAPIATMPDGAHTIVATAVDSVGNSGPTSVSTTFTIDGTAPTGPVITAPAVDAFLSTATPSLEGTAEVGSQVIVREGDFTVCTAMTGAATTQWKCVPSAPLAEGQHSVSATATDAVGNESAPSTARAFTIDTSAPDTSFSKQPPSRTFDRNASFAYASTEANTHFECSLDDGAFSPCSDSYDVVVGEHVLRARAVDRAGNVDPSPAEARWTVEGSETPTPVDPQPAAPDALPEKSGGGCSAAPGTTSNGSAWLILLGLACLRRPSRRRQSSSPFLEAK